MNKKYIITKNYDIQKIISFNNKIVSKYFIIYFKRNNLTYNKYCISISKKIGKAFYRNFLKRQIKEILRNLNFTNNTDYVIIVRKSIVSLSFYEIKEHLNEVFLKKGVFNYEKKEY